MSNKYFPPKYKAKAFTCPHCGVYANQLWGDLCNVTTGAHLSNFSNCCCSHCSNYSIWLHEEMVYPFISNLPEVNENLPDDIKKIYNEAKGVFNISPKASCALLRLAIQNLCLLLGEGNKDLNIAIGNLVKKGLPSGVQQALDIVRVIGNNAVHPGVINIEDNLDVASLLFDLVNFIAEKMITEPMQLENIYNRLPEHNRKAILQRDSKI